MKHKGYGGLIMKGLTKIVTMTAVLALLGACSNRIVEMDQLDVKGNPAWYEDCKQIGSEGWLFWKTDFAYSCGMGQSKFEQASESQAYAFAVKGFAERINGTVNSRTVVDINNDTRSTRTYVEHSVKDTVIREHLEVRKKNFEHTGSGHVHTYVRIKMPLEVFDRLIQEARDDKTVALNNNL